MVLAFTRLGLKLVYRENPRTLIYIKYAAATSSTFLAEAFKPGTDR